MNYTDFLSSAKGDIYQISLSSKNGGLIADDVRQSLSTEGIIVMDVELNRVQGLNPTTNAVLSKIGEKIANVFLANPNVIICYFCDFLSELPYTNKRHKNLSVQEYRSILFSQMFDRYVSQHHLENVSLAVLTIEGVEETYYVHIVARSEHLRYISQINDGIQRDFGK